MACTCTGGQELGDDLRYHPCVVCRPPATTGRGAAERTRIANTNAAQQAQKENRRGK